MITLMVRQKEYELKRKKLVVGKPVAKHVPNAMSGVCNDRIS